MGTLVKDAKDEFSEFKEGDAFKKLEYHLELTDEVIQFVGPDALGLDEAMLESNEYKLVFTLCADVAGIDYDSATWEQELCNTIITYTVERVIEDYEESNK